MFVKDACQFPQKPRFELQVHCIINSKGKSSRPNPKAEWQSGLVLNGLRIDRMAGTKGAKCPIRSLAEYRFKHTCERRIRNRLGGNKNHDAFERGTHLETS